MDVKSKITEGTMLAAVELHYQNKIKALEKQLATSTSKLKDAMMLLDRKDIIIAEKDVYIEALRTAFVDATIRGGKQ